jgi:hypothetical protein
VNEFASAVCAVDYDRDGRIDLFVGARTVPGDWPHSGRSRLLHNESKGAEVKFTDVTATVPGIGNVGLVTAALWSDADGDGWAGLVGGDRMGPDQTLSQHPRKTPGTHRAGGSREYHRLVAQLAAIDSITMAILITWRRTSA